MTERLNLEYIESPTRVKFLHYLAYIADSESTEPFENLNNSFQEQIKTNPAHAVEELEFVLHDVWNESKGLPKERKVDYRGWSTFEMNGLGVIYPSLPHNARRIGLLKALNGLDRHNYFGSQGEVGDLDEPLLVADILANRVLYWGGFKDLLPKLTAHTWDEFTEKVYPLRSFAWLSLAISYKQYPSPEVREGFKTHFPNLVERTQSIIAVHAFGHAERALKRGDTTTMEEGYEETLANYDSALHEGVRAIIQNKAWVQLEK